MPKLDLSGHALINNQSPPDGSKTKVFIDGKLSENVNYLTQICPAIKSLVFLTKFAFRGKKRKEANYDGNDTELACHQLGQFFYLGDQSTHKKAKNSGSRAVTLDDDAPPFVFR
ncbi:MAG: hypothetical protein P8X85_09295 [Desulfobacterales bacterium]